jgi:hypothetical protein
MYTLNPHTTTNTMGSHKNIIDDSIAMNFSEPSESTLYKDQYRRRKNAYNWYKLLAQPTRATMCRILDYTKGADFTRHDLDLLPWNLEESEVTEEAMKSLKKEKKKQKQAKKKDTKEKKENKEVSGKPGKSSLKISPSSSSTIIPRISSRSSPRSIPRSSLRSNSIPRSSLRSSLHGKEDTVKTLDIAVKSNGYNRHQTFLKEELGDSLTSLGSSLDSSSGYLDASCIAAESNGNNKHQTFVKEELGVSLTSLETSQDSSSCYLDERFSIWDQDDTRHDRDKGKDQDGTRHKRDKGKFEDEFCINFEVTQTIKSKEERPQKRDEAKKRSMLEGDTEGKIKDDSEDARRESAFLWYAKGPGFSRQDVDFSRQDDDIWNLDESEIIGEFMKSLKKEKTKKKQTKKKDTKEKKENKEVSGEPGKSSLSSSPMSSPRSIPRSSLSSIPRSSLRSIPRSSLRSSLHGREGTVKTLDIAVKSNGYNSLKSSPMISPRISPRSSVKSSLRSSLHGKEDTVKTLDIAAKSNGYNKRQTFLKEELGDSLTSLESSLDSSSGYLNASCIAVESNGNNKHQTFVKEELGDSLTCTETSLDSTMHNNGSLDASFIAAKSNGNNKHQAFLKEELGDSLTCMHTSPHSKEKTEKKQTKKKKDTKEKKEKKEVSGKLGKSSRHSREDTVKTLDIGAKSNGSNKHQTFLREEAKEKNILGGDTEGEIKEDSKDARRERAFLWYARMVIPCRKEFKRKVEALVWADITADDVDLLPWNLTGSAVNVAKMNAMIRASTMKK